jgi:hypothetical protein
VSEQPAGERRCSNCGNVAPAYARFCPVCGAQLAGVTGEAGTFEDAIAEVLGEEQAGSQPLPELPPQSQSPWDQPTSRVEPPGSGWIDVTPTQSSDSPPSSSYSDPPGGWTASSSSWSQPTPPTGAWSSEPVSSAPPQKSGNRVLWIVLGIIGFVIFCCCAFFLFSVAVSGSDATLQEELRTSFLLPASFS